MEIALTTLGGLLIVASFEIQYRYHSLAKEYYGSALKECVKELMATLNKMNKMAGEDPDIIIDMSKVAIEDLAKHPIIHKVIDESEVAIEEIALKRWYANFPNFLFYGIALLGIYIGVIGFFYEAIIELMPLPILFFFDTYWNIYFNTNLNRITGFKKSNKNKLR